jgi:hypothetical protein
MLDAGRKQIVSYSSLKAHICKVKGKLDEICLIGAMSVAQYFSSTNDLAAKNG